MPADVVTGAARVPRRARYLVPRNMRRRGEFLAACAVALVVAHALFAQLTLAVAVSCSLTGRLTRWRATWLLAPALAGAAWTVAVGPRAALAGFLAGPEHVIGYLTATGTGLPHVLRPGGAFAGAATWLPRQLPFAMLAGTAEAGLASLLSWLHTDEWNLPRHRPGLIAAARRATAVWAIRSGAVLGGDGASLGVTRGRGGRVTVSWAEAEAGLLCYGASAAEPLAAGFQVILAALRARKPVIVADFSGTARLPGRLASACADNGTQLLAFAGAAGSGPGTRPACYEPLRHGDPAERAALITGMTRWDGADSQHRRSCAGYLTDVFELLDAAPGDPRVPVLDEVIHLLDPAALRARAAHVPPLWPRRAALADRAAASAALLTADQGIAAGLSRQLRLLRSATVARWLSQPPGAQVGEIVADQIVGTRGAALFSLGVAGDPGAAMVMRLLCLDLRRLAGRLARLGVRADAVIWLAGCERVPEPSLTSLLGAAPDAGMAVIATTSDGSAAAALAGQVGGLLLHRVAEHAVARRLAAVAAPALPAGPGGIEQVPALSADHLTGLAAGEFVLAVRRPAPRLVARAIAVAADRWGPW